MADPAVAISHLPLNGESSQLNERGHGGPPPTTCYDSVAFQILTCEGTSSCLGSIFLLLVVTTRCDSLDTTKTQRGNCAISLVTDLRRPLFADVMMAKSVLTCLLSDQTLEHMRLRAFTLMPDHLHFLAGVRNPDKKLPNLIGLFKSYTTQQYWKRSRHIVNTRQVVLPSGCVTKATLNESRPLISALMDWRATLRLEVVELRNWPKVMPAHFLKKRLWQTRVWDHVIRNDFDLQENIDYIAMNPVREGYVTHPQFYPYTGFML